MSDRGTILSQVTVGGRVAEYERIIRLTTVIGAALLGEVALLNALHPNTPHQELLEAVFVTLFVATAALAALARGGCEWQVDLIKFYKSTNAISDSMSMSEAIRKSNSAIAFDLRWARYEYYAAATLVALPGVIVLLLVWFTLFMPKPLLTTQVFNL